MSAFRRRFKKALILAGIEREVRVHDMRHGATTDLRSVFDADAVRKLVGHKDARTAQRYSHARDQADAASKWSAYLAERIGSAEK
jgi:integrase